MTFALQYTVAYLIVDALCLVLTLIIAAAVTHDLGTRDQNRYFLLMLAMFMVFVIFDGVWALLAYSGFFAPSAIVLSVVNGINLTTIACDGYFWTRFTLAYFDHDARHRRIRRYVTAFPALLVPVLHAIGFAIGQNVIVHPDGSMTYGWMHTAIICVQLFYVAEATFISAREFFRTTFKARRRMCLVFMSFMLPFVVGGVVDSIIANTPVAAACIVSSFTFVMLAMQESRISSDALTGLNNRRRTDAYLEERIAHASVGHPLHLFLIDLDKFKNINDTYGHLEGDSALRLMADVLRFVCARTNAFAARWGGDEFVVIYTQPTRDPQEMMDFISDTLTQQAIDAGLPYRLTCSIGHAVCDRPNTDSDQVVADADAMLYRAKHAKRGR